jgi:hypothetical protein
VGVTGLGVARTRWLLGWGLIVGAELDEESGGAALEVCGGNEDGGGAVWGYGAGRRRKELGASEAG